MPASQFFEKLPVLEKKTGTQLGVCAMGPIGDGDKIIWMRVWLWQQDGDNVPAAAGNAGEHVPGAQRLTKDGKLPFAAPDKRWMVQAALEPDSPDFNLKKPALVQAIAEVERNGESHIVQWSQAVALHKPHHY